MRVKPVMRILVMCTVWMIVVTVGLSQAPPAPPAAAADAAPAAAEASGTEVTTAAAGPGEEIKPRLSLLKLIFLGGPVMIPLGLMSIVAVGIIAERMLSLRRKNVIPEGFIQGLLDAMVLDEGEEKTRHAQAYCEQASGPVGDIFKAGMVRVGRSEDVIEKAIEDAAYREVDKLKRSLKGLAVIASVSPLLGLLGTVYGMIAAFQDATIAGMGKADMLAEGIYEALVTTAAGLTIAIPVLIAYQILATRVDSLVDEIDVMCHEFMNNYFDLRERAS